MEQLADRRMIREDRATASIEDDSEEDEGDDDGDDDEDDEDDEEEEEEEEEEEVRGSIRFTFRSTQSTCHPAHDRGSKGRGGQEDVLDLRSPDVRAASPSSVPRTSSARAATPVVTRTRG